MSVLFPNLPSVSRSSSMSALWGFLPKLWKALSDGELLKLRDSRVRRGRKNHNAVDEDRLTCGLDLRILEGFHEGSLKAHGQLLLRPGSGHVGNTRGSRRVAQLPGAREN